MDILIYHNEKLHRFEFLLAGSHASIEYTIGPETIVFHHSQLPAASHNGEADPCEELIRIAITYARENHLKIIATCPEIRKYIRTHPCDFISVGRIFQSTT